MVSQNRPRVALIIESSSAFGRGVMEGICRFLRTQHAWSVSMDQMDLMSQVSDWSWNWDGDGIISRSTTPDFAERFLNRGIPFVDLTDRYGPLGLPTIWVDHQQIGRLAADHFLERGFQKFGYIGFSGEYWSDLRRQGFQNRIEELGYSCQIRTIPWMPETKDDWDQEHDQLVAWLEELPKAAGVMACNDVCGQRVLDACLEAGFSVPEQIAVVGCDNDVNRCELTDPKLSSVIPNAPQVGYRAAQLLDQFMLQGKWYEHQELISPIGIETRTSTDIFAIDDPIIAQAVRYIRDHALEGITVNDVTEAVSLSRSALERGMRQYLNRSPQAEIREVQLKWARQLLTETDFPLKEIAKRCGFEHAEYFSVVFKRELKETPGAFRKRTRAD